MGQSNGVLLKDVIAFRTCTLIEISQYIGNGFCPYQ